MENTKKIFNVKTTTKNGQLYLCYSVNSNGQINDFEIPYYDQNGKIDPEVAAILDIAKKSEEKDKDNSEQNSSNKLPVKQDTRVTIYKKPEEMPKSANISKDILGYVAAGLGGVLIGVTIMAACRGCSKQKTTNYNSDTDSDTKIEQTEDTIEYISEEEFTNGVKELTSYVNGAFGFTYQPVELTALYYSANMDVISNDLFAKLVSEAYLPDTDMDIAIKTLSVLDSLQSTTGVEGVSKDRIDFDFSKLFIRQDAIDINNYYKEKYNAISSASLEQIVAIVDELEDYMLMDVTKGYDNLSAGEQLIFNNYVADAISIAANSKDVHTTSAFDTQINNVTVTKYVDSLSGKLACMTAEEAEKTLTK